MQSLSLHGGRGAGGSQGGGRREDEQATKSNGNRNWIEIRQNDVGCRVPAG